MGALDPFVDPKFAKKSLADFEKMFPGVVKRSGESKRVRRNGASAQSERRITLFGNGLSDYRST
jgi:hypothetical protein